MLGMKKTLKYLCVLKVVAPLEEPVSLPWLYGKPV